MSYNFLLNPNQTRPKHPNPTDLYLDIAEKIIKKKLNQDRCPKHNTNHYSYQDEKKLIELENSYKKSAVLLNIMQKKIEQTMLEKYELKQDRNSIAKNSNDDVIHNVLMKKKFLNKMNQIFSMIKWNFLINNH